MDLQTLYSNLVVPNHLMVIDGRPQMTLKVETLNLGQLQEVIMEQLGLHYQPFLTLLQLLQEIHGKRHKPIKIGDLSFT
jgi:hypothetical protein